MPAPSVATAAPAASRLLLPGQWQFSQSPVQLRTLLGSCVAVTLWHPQRGIGGMCHFLLPRRRRLGPEPLDGRFGNEAVELLVQDLKRAGTRPADYVAHLYGGADTMASQAGLQFNIGERNIEMAWRLIDEHGFNLENVDVGDAVPRTVTLDVGSGEVTMRRGQTP